MALANVLNTGQLLSVSSSPRFFSITSATSILKGSVSGQVSLVPQADAGTYNFNIPITAGTSGYFLTSGGGGSSPMTWTNPASGLVTSITGTANQIGVSPTTGAAVVSLTNGISIGSYQAISSPTGGAIMPGQLGVGTSSPNALTKAQFTSASAYNTVFSGTQTADDGTVVATILMNSVLAPIDSSVVTWANYLLPTFQAAGGNTISGAATIWLTASASGNSGTITELSGIHIDIGTAGGTITTGYGIYIRSLAYGTTRYGLYVENPAAGTATALYAGNASIGFIATPPPSSGLIVSGQTAIGTSTPTTLASLTVANSSSQYIAANIKGTLTAVDSGPLQYGLYLTNTFSPTSGASFAFQVYSNPTVAIPSGQSADFADFLASPLFTGNLGTITHYYGFRFDGGGSIPGGTITTSYGAFIAHPIATASTSIALYTEDLAIGTSGTRPPTNGFFSLGSGVVGDSVANGKAILTVTSTTQGFLPPRMTSTQKNAISTPPAGLVVYDSTALDLEFFNGTSWIGTTISGVTGITGVANQVLANGTSGSSQVGSVTLTLPQSIATTSTVQFGKAIIGTNSGTTMTLQLLGAVGDLYSLYSQRLSSTLDGSNDAYSVGLYDTLSPVGSYTSGFGIQNETAFAARSAQTATNAYAYYGAPIYNLNVGTISNVYNMYLQAGTSAAGTITNAWGLVVELPTAGATTNTCAAFIGTTVVGATSPDSKSILTVTSTTLGFLPPRMTTTQKNAISSPTEGLVVYDNVLHDLQFYNGSTWISDAGVLSIAGTGNQITASASTGAITLSIPSDFRPPGTIALGGGPQGNTASTISATGQYAEYITGTLATASADLTGIFVNNILAPATAHKAYGIQVGSSFTNPGSGTLVEAASLYANPTFTGSGTTSSGYGLLVSVGASTTTVTTGYGIRINALAFGTTRYALYADAPTGGTTNYGAFIGGVSGLNRSTDVNVQVGITCTASSVGYGLYMDGTVSAGTSSNMYGVQLVPHITPTSSSFNGYCLSVSPTFVSGASNVNAVFGQFITQTINGSGTVADSRMLAIDVGSLSGPTVSIAYSLKIEPISYGSVRYAIFAADNPGFYGMYMGGITSFGNVTGPLTGVGVNITYSISTTGNTVGLRVVNQFATGTTMSTADNLYSSLDLSNNSGTISTAYNFRTDTGATAGTVTTGYGAFITALGFGTTRYGLRVQQPTAGSTNYTAHFDVGVGIGTVNAATTGNGAAFKVSATSGYNTWISGTQTADDGATTIGLLVVPSYNPANNNKSCINLYAVPVFNAVTMQTITAATNVYVHTTFTGNAGTISTVYGVFIDGGGASVGTITSHYSLYVNTPIAGTTKICAYFEGPVQYGTNSTGAGTALLSTNCPAVTVSAPYTWIKVITSDNSTAYVPCWK